MTHNRFGFVCGFAGSAVGPRGCDWNLDCIVFLLSCSSWFVAPCGCQFCLGGDLYCLLTWCLPAELWLLSGLEEWVPCTPTHHCCRLCSVMRSAKPFFRFQLLAVILQQDSMLEVLCNLPYLKLQQLVS